MLKCYWPRPRLASAALGTATATASSFGLGLCQRVRERRRRSRRKTERLKVEGLSVAKQLFAGKTINVEASVTFHTGSPLVPDNVVVAPLFFKLFLFIVISYFPLLLCGFCRSRSTIPPPQGRNPAHLTGTAVF